jgi:DNA-binding HxlR family transcriptional regulator
MRAEQQSKTGASIYIGKWTPKVLFSLNDRPYRHGRLRRRIGSVSQRMLTRTLRNLESTGLIVRYVTGTKAIAVEYSLTQLGRTLIVPLKECAAGRDDTAEGLAQKCCLWRFKLGRRIEVRILGHQRPVVVACKKDSRKGEQQ